MKKIVLVGGGGHCISVLDSLLESNQYDEIVITEGNTENIGQSIYGCKVIGTDDVLPKLKDSGFEYAFVTVGGGEKPSTRIHVVEKVLKLGFIIPNIIDNTAKVSSRTNLGTGIFVGKNAVVNAGAQIGNHCIINTGAIIEHECVVEDYSHISVGTVLCGKSQVGYGSFVGAGSTIIHDVRVGNNVIIGANSTVIRDTGDNIKLVGIGKIISK